MTQHCCFCSGFDCGGYHEGWSSCEDHYPAKTIAVQSDEIDRQIEEKITLKKENERLKAENEKLELKCDELRNTKAVINQVRLEADNKTLRQRIEKLREALHKIFREYLDQDSCLHYYAGKADMVCWAREAVRSDDEMAKDTSPNG